MKYVGSISAVQKVLIRLVRTSYWSWCEYMLSDSDAQNSIAPESLIRSVSDL